MEVYDSVNDIPLPILETLFSADADEEIFIQIAGNKTLKVAERENAYVFSYANNPQDTTSFAFMKDGENPPQLESDSSLDDYHGQIVTTEDGSENLYITNTGNAYILNEDGSFDREGSNIVEVNNGNIGEADAEVPEGEVSLELIEAYHSTNTADEIAWDINEGVLGSDRPKASEMRMNKLHDGEDGVVRKTNLATSLKSIIFKGGENQATNLPSDDEIMAYVEGIDPDQTLEDWFNSINILDNNGSLSAVEAVYAVTGEASVTVPDRDSFVDVVQTDFDELAVNWSEETTGTDGSTTQYGTVEIGEEPYMLKYQNGEYSYFNIVLNQYVPF